MEILRATRAYINLDALRSNLSLIRSALPPGHPVCAAVKADAYGHGAVRVAAALRDAGVEFLGVATPFEGLELREAGDGGGILLYGPTTPEEIPVTVAAGLEPMVTGRNYLEALAGEKAKAGGSAPLRAHLKVDTGMGRVGCPPEEALALARLIDRSPELELAGVATHFPVGDSETEENMAFTDRQISILKGIAGDLEADGIDPGIVHAANSGGIALSPGSALGMVRPGIALYGYGPRIPGDRELRPVMEMKTRITAVKKVRAGQTISYGRTWTADRDAWIATLPVGYADGYSRLLSNKARVLIKGRTHPVAGTVCMDQTMVRLDDAGDIRPNDEATLFGPDPAGPDAEEIASIMGTISYEVTCGISRRVPRIYVTSRG